MEKEFDIKKRTLNYSVMLLSFTRQLSNDTETQIIKRQLVRSGTSIGANVYESNGGHSKKDFANYMNIALKSANETIYWLTLLTAVSPKFESEIVALCAETEELAKILARIAIHARS